MNEPWNVYPTLTPEQEEKRRIRRSANFCGGVLLAMTAVQYLINVIFGVLHGVGAIDLTLADWGIGFTAYEILNMLLYVLFLPAPAIAVAVLCRCRVSPFPSRPVKPWLLLCLVPAGMAMAVLSNIVTNYFMMVMQSIGVPYPSFPDTLQTTTLSLWLNILSTAVLPALAEEMIFRGYIQGALRPWGDAPAVVLTAFIFGLFHGNILQFPFAFILGLVFGWLTVQSGSIWPAVLLHFGNNLMSVLLDYYGKLYPERDAFFGDATFIIVAAVGVIAMAALLVNDRGGSARRDVLRPMGNGLSPLPVRTRVVTVLTAPAMLISLILMVLQLVSSMVAV